MASIADEKGAAVRVKAGLKQTTTNVAKFIYHILRHSFICPVTKVLHGPIYIGN